MERKERQLAMMHEISAFVLENPRPEEVIQVVAEAIHRGIGFNRTLLFLLNPGKESMIGKVGLGFNVPPSLKKVVVPVDSGGLMSKGLQDKVAFNVVDSESALYRDLPPLEIESLIQTKSFALVPLLAGADAIGVILVDNTFTREPIRDREVDAIKTFINMAGMYLEKYRNKPPS